MCEGGRVLSEWCVMRRLDGSAAAEGVAADGTGDPAAHQPTLYAGTRTHAHTHNVRAIIITITPPTSITLSASSLEHT